MVKPKNEKSKCVFVKIMVSFEKTCLDKFEKHSCLVWSLTTLTLLDHVVQSVAWLTQEPAVPGSMPSLATYFHFSFSCQLLAKVLLPLVRMAENCYQRAHNIEMASYWNLCDMTTSHRSTSEWHHFDNMCPLGSNLSIYIQNCGS